MPVETFELRAAIQHVDSEVVHDPIWTARIGGALLDGGDIATIDAAGFVDVEATWRGTPFMGASGQRKADTLETEGVNISARKP